MKGLHHSISQIMFQCNIREKKYRFSYIGKSKFYSFPKTYNSIIGHIYAWA